MILAAASWPCAAVDVAIVDRPVSEEDHRRDFANVLLRTVMERTEPAWGPYQIKEAPVFMERQRLLSAMQLGKQVNIAAIPADKEWMATLPSIPIPIDLGLQSWRIALIDARQQQRLSALAAGGQLKQATAGVGTTWALRGVLENNAYPIVTGNSYDGLFLMLKAGRFDYFPRSINDIFDEVESHRRQFPNLAIEQSMVLYARVPWLFFISPQQERLRARVAAGMEAMLKDRSLERLVLKYYRTELTQARLCGRVRIDVPNPALAPAIQARSELWIDPFEARHGLCPPASPASRLAR